MPEQPHTALIAGRGSGRTPALHHLIASLRSHGTQVWLVDPGEQHHGLADHVDRHGAGVTGAIDMLQAAAALIRQRQEALGQDTSDAVVQVLVDDAKAIADQPGGAELLLDILLSGRPVGVREDVIAEPGRDPFPGHPHLHAAFTRPRSR